MKARGESVRPTKYLGVAAGLVLSVASMAMAAPVSAANKPAYRAPVTSPHPIKPLPPSPRPAPTHPHR
jgi:hypothetical protein